MLLNYASESYPGEDLHVESLHLAIHFQYTCVISQILEYRAKLNLSVPTEKDLIFYTVESKKISAVRTLVKCGIGVNWRNDQGENVLFLAAREGLLEIGSYLVDSGADLSVRSKQETTAIQILLDSCLSGKVELDEASMLNIAISSSPGDACKMLSTSANPFALCLSSQPKHIAPEEEVFPPNFHETFKFLVEHSPSC